MDEDKVWQSRFAQVMRGYNRDQVDAFLEACAHWSNDARSRIEGTEGKLEEANRRAEALKARLEELESRAEAGPPPAVVSLSERIEQMLGSVQEAAAELQVNAEADARNEKEEIKRSAVQLRQAARAKAKQIVATAKREQEAAAPSFKEARKAAARCIEEGRVAATEHGEAVWQRGRGAMQEVEDELVRLEEERRAAVEELRELQRSLEVMVQVP